jgi:predicted metalloprotease
MGLGGALVLVVLSLLFGRDFFGAAAAGEPEYAAGAPVEATPEEERLVDFVSFVLDTAQATWNRVLSAQGIDYRPAKLVLFRDAVQSACGFGQSATGPFYCPGDRKIYVDLAFFAALDTRLGAPGDFAQAYVLAHEIGHHVQNVIGLMEIPHEDSNISVRLELQADCLAGVWGHHANMEQMLQGGDLEEALNAAAAVGDDRLQPGSVRPETFTHGSSAQRTAWFRRGVVSGQVGDCDTFSTPHVAPSSGPETRPTVHATSGRLHR